MAKKFDLGSYRKSQATPLKEAIEGMLKAYKIDYKYNETALLNSWEEVMGKTISSRTTKLYIRNKILYVELSSAPLKNDLSLSKAKVIELLNKNLEKEIITDVVFL